jgi:Methylase of chemotaxis methyl-accepting proteins
MKFEHLFFHGVSTVRNRANRTWRSERRTTLRVAGGDEVAEVEQFMRTLLASADLPASAYRRHALVRRWPACLRHLRATDAREASRVLAEQPEKAGALLSVVLLGVTDFFRDEGVFQQLRSGVLPELLRRQRRVRVWSAACSNGQELYSVAMLMARSGRLGDCELLGTDCRAEAIAEARRGVFREEEVARIEPELREAFFEAGGARAIDPRLRRAAQWKVANLFGEIERGPWHLILWRNMAIYLESERAEEIWARLVDQLAPGGFLVAGKADTPPKWLRLTRVAPCIYQKEGR